MAKQIFVDTSGWYALVDRRDQHHPAARKLIEEKVGAGSRLVTTDYVVDESCTLARMRGGWSAAARLLDLLHESASIDWEWIGAERFEQAERWFRRYRDQAYSFTDCASFAVMRELRLREVLTSDAHFRAAGFQPLLATPPGR
jgi:predicted nucleic acid-binding protein